MRRKSPAADAQPKYVTSMKGAWGVARTVQCEDMTELYCVETSAKHQISYQHTFAMRVRVCTSAILIRENFSVLCLGFHDRCIAVRKSQF